MSMGAEQFRVVGGEFHPCFKPVAMQSVVAAQTGDVFQPLEHAAVARRELIRNAESPFGPFVMLKMRGRQAQSVSGVAVEVE